MTDDVAQLEQQIFDLTTKLNAARAAQTPVEIPDYDFDTLTGPTTLRTLFAGKDRLLVIHNMGQGCRYCTLWGDGINGFIPHLESALSVVMVSKDPPEVQQRFANSRQWRMRMASHGGGAYQAEQVAYGDESNAPGVACYERKDDTIYRLSSAAFGPGDLYCSMWNFLALAGLDAATWTPQFDYWRRPDLLDDGGANLLGERCSIEG